MDQVQLLVINADKPFCDLLERTVSLWGMLATSLPNGPRVPPEILQHDYAIILVDLGRRDPDALTLLACLCEVCRETKIIAITDHAEHAIIRQALQMGVFGCVEKPVALDRLQHTVQQAVKSLTIEREHQAALAALEQKNLEVMELYEACAKFAKLLERVRIATEMSIKSYIRTLVTPIIQKIKSRESFETYEMQLNMLANYIESPIVKPIDVRQDGMQLSSREWNIALMIKGGMTDQAIADQLYISYETVKAHRRNIRKKLGITGTKSRLNAYLQTLNGDYTDITYISNLHLSAIDADISLEHYS